MLTSLLLLFGNKKLINNDNDFFAIDDETDTIVSLFKDNSLTMF